MSIKPLMWSFSQCLHVIRSCQNNTWMLNVLTTRCLKTNILENLLIGVFYDHYIIKYLVLLMTFNTPCLLAAYQIPSQGSISINTRDRPILMRGTGGVMNLLKPQAIFVPMRISQNIFVSYENTGKIFSIMSLKQLIEKFNFVILWISFSLRYPPPFRILLIKTFAFPRKVYVLNGSNVIYAGKLSNQVSATRVNSRRGVHV